jgi:hypothetical protein
MTKQELKKKLISIRQGAMITPLLEELWPMIGHDIHWIFRNKYARWTKIKFIINKYAYGIKRFWRKSRYRDHNN